MKKATLLMWDDYTNESALVTDLDDNFVFEFEDNVTPEQILKFMDKVCLKDYDVTEHTMELQSSHKLTDKIWIIHDQTEGINGVTIVNWE